MNELALFAGAGGGILGGHLLGWRTVCAVEWEPYPASVLVARQNDGFLPPFPVWDDVQTFDGHPWRGIVDVISGGFPCQDISAAGKGEGITGSRSSMWKHMARIISEVRPQFVFVENSPMLTIRGLGVVLGDLSEMGFNAEWGVISAADIGAPHLRERIWIVAKDTQQRDILPHTINDRHRWGKQQSQSITEKNRNVANSNCKGEQWEHGIQVDGCSRCNIGETNAKNAKECGEMERVREMANTQGSGWNSSSQSEMDGKEMEQGRGCGFDDCSQNERERIQTKMANTSMSGLKTRSKQAFRPQQRVLEEQLRRSGHEYRAGRYNWPSEPNVGRVVNGMASRVDRLKAIGNGQVSGVAATAWTLLNERFNK
jgi:DNA (cytosine-5)-methyltransferase 1